MNQLRQIGVAAAAIVLALAMLSAVNTTAANAQGPTCLGRAATHVGTAGNDVITGTPGRDVIVAFAGDDDIRGLGDRDIICAGPGNDRVWSGGGNDSVRLGPGRDRAWGGPGDDRILGATGRDTILGGAGEDELLGGAGTDLTSGGPASDVCRSELRNLCGTQPAPNQNAVVQAPVCASQVNSLDLIECETVLRNTSSGYATVTARANLLNANGTVIDDTVRIEGLLEPGERWATLFLGPPGTVSAQITEVTARSTDGPVITGGSVPESFGNDIFMPIDRAAVTVGPRVVEANGSVSWSITSRNLEAATGSIFPTVAFYDSAGTRLDTRTRIGFGIEPGDTFTEDFIFSTGDAVSIRVLRVELNP